MFVLLDFGPTNQGPERHYWWDTIPVNVIIEAQASINAIDILIGQWTMIYAVRPRTWEESVPATAWMMDGNRMVSAISIAHRSIFSWSRADLSIFEVL